jgi:hypothetical protein
MGMKLVKRKKKKENTDTADIHLRTTRASGLDMQCRSPKAILIIRDPVEAGEK